MGYPLNELIAYGTHLKSIHSERNAQMDAMEKMFLMDWDDEERIKNIMDNVKLTKSPDTRNKLLGAVCLLVATDPAFSVPVAGDMLDDRLASKLEQAATEMWTRSGRIRKDPVHYDVVLSLLLFSETHIGITKTADMVEYSRKAPKAYK